MTSVTLEHSCLDSLYLVGIYPEDSAVPTRHVIVASSFIYLPYHWIYWGKNLRTLSCPLLHRASVEHRLRIYALYPRL